MVGKRDAQVRRGRSDLANERSLRKVEAWFKEQIGMEPANAGQPRLVLHVGIGATKMEALILVGAGGAREGRGRIAGVRACYHGDGQVGGAELVGCCWGASGPGLELLWRESGPGHPRRRREAGPVRMAERGRQAEGERSSRCCLTHQSGWDRARKVPV